MLKFNPFQGILSKKEKLISIDTIVIARSAINVVYLRANYGMYR